MTIYEDANVTVKYDSSVPCIVWTPLQFMKDDAWRIPFMKGVDFLAEQIKTTPDITWLNDTRKLKSVQVEDLKWLNKNVNDRCFSYGLKKVVFVLPDNIFGKMAVKFYVEFTNARVDNKFKIKAFNSYTDAVSWLRAKSDVGAREVSL
jgi:hypothetical protein